MEKKCGVVITTHGNNGIYAIQCLNCFLKHLPNSFIVFFVNTSSDEKILSVEKNYPGVKYIYVEDQEKNGDLTGTWNQGIDICIENNCEIIVLSNDDIYFDKSIHFIINEASKCKENEMKYFGPITNNPGPNKKTKQYGEFPKKKCHFYVKIISV